MITRQGKAHHYTGRWHDTRLLSAQGYSAPYVFDRRTGQLTPHHRDEWVYDERTAKLWPVIRGGAGVSAQQNPRLRLGLIGLAAGALTTTALNTAYTYGTGGIALAGRWIGPAKTLSSLYCYLTAETGSATTLNWSVRNSTTSSIPDTTLLGSGTINPTGLVGSPSWFGATGLSVSLSADTDYWMIWADADADGSNFYTMGRYAGLFNTAEGDYPGRNHLRTTTGFASGNTTEARLSLIAWGFSDSTSAGTALQPAAAFASTSDRRGIHLNSGFTEQIKFFGMIAHGTITNLSGLEIYTNAATTPGTGAESIGSVAPLRYSGGIQGYYCSTPFTLAKETGYRIVFTFSGNSTTLNYYPIGTGADSVLAGTMMGGGGWYTAQANGTTDWRTLIDGSGISLTYTFPRVIVLLENQVAVAGGGGGIAHIIGG